MKFKKLKLTKKVRKIVFTSIAVLLPFIWYGGAELAYRHNNEELASTLFKPFAIIGIPDAQYKLGVSFLERGKGYEYSEHANKEKELEYLAEAIFWVYKAAEKGNVDAQWKLGDIMYDWDFVFGFTRAEALMWYEKAAENDKWKQYALGRKYYLGSGVAVVKDYEQAFKWYLRAAKQGLVRAQYEVGNMYYYGLGVDRDEQKAKEWLEKVVEQKDGNFNSRMEANYKLGNIYEHQEKGAGVYYYTEAAEQGNEYAQVIMGNAYLNGIGVSPNFDKAVELYEKAANSILTKRDVLIPLGDAYRYRAKNYYKAVEWYREAAEEGMSEGQYKLGEMYENGDGIEPSLSSALHWYEKACEKWMQKACKKYEQLKGKQ